MNNIDMKYISELHKPGRVKVIGLTNGVIVTDGLKGNAIVLDQDKLMGHAFGINNVGNGKGVQLKNPYTITSFKYDQISFVKTVSSKEGLDHAINKLVSDEIITEEKAEELRKTMDIDELLKRLDPLP